MFDMVSQSLKGVPDEDREQFIQDLLTNVCFEVIEGVMLAAMIEHLSLDEIIEITDYCSSPAGQSTIAKAALLLTTIGLVFNAEMARACQESQQSQV